MENLDAVIQEKLEADVDFIASLENLSDEDKEVEIEKKKSELIKQEYASIAEKAKKAETIANDQKVRAEKAEQLLKSKPTVVTDKEVKNDDKEFSPSDLYALMESKVPSQHLDEVKNIAKILKCSIPEALKNDLTKTRLAQLAEIEKSASVSNMGNQKKNIQKVTPDKLLNELSEGKVPEKGSPEAEELFWAKRGGRRT